MKILVLARKNSGPDYHRLILPFRYIKLEDSDSVNFIFPDERLTSEHLKVDIVIFNRIPNYDIDTLLRLRKKIGFKLIMDIDDYWVIPENHIIWANWTANNLEKKFKDIISVSDHIIVTNSQLEVKVRPLNNNVTVIPNALTDSDQFKYNRSNSRIKRFSYIGGNTHYNDIKTIAPLFKELRYNKSWLQDCRFILFGITKTDHNVFEKINEIIKPCKNVSRVLMLPIEQYMKSYDITDISIAPLEDNEFNSCKSTLKIIEAGFKKCPIIVSAVYPYLEDINAPGVTFCKTTEDWISAFNKYIDNNSYIEDGENLHEYVKQKYNLNDANQKRVSLFKSLIK